MDKSHLAMKGEFWVVKALFRTGRGLPWSLRYFMPGSNGSRHISISTLYLFAGSSTVYGRCSLLAFLCHAMLSCSAHGLGRLGPGVYDKSVTSLVAPCLR